jgi:hypothetical protein
MIRAKKTDMEIASGEVLFINEAEISASTWR